jgi:hypothetical protein
MRIIFNSPHFIRKQQEKNMFRKINNKTLLVLFAILAIAAIIVYVYDSNKGERTFRSELFKVDSAAVTSITIYKKGSEKDFIKLIKTGKGWEIQIQKKQYPADTTTIKSILQVLTRVSPERVAGSDKSSWKEFEITDSLSRRVVVEQGKDVTADFRTGKVSFSQDRSRQSYNGSGMEVKSHIRVPGDDRVYVVDGYLSVMFYDNPSLYRNRLVMKLDKKNLTKLSFIYPGDSSFFLLKEGKKWFLNDQPADSALTEQWLNSMSFLSNGDFADEEAQPFSFPFNLRIEGNNMSVIEVKGAADIVAKKYFVRSSANPSAVFGGVSPGLFNQVFPGKNKFLEAKESTKKKNKQ